jgi:hypothetical protein
MFSAGMGSLAESNRILSERLRTELVFVGDGPDLTTAAVWFHLRWLLAISIAGKAWSSIGRDSSRGRSGIVTNSTTAMPPSSDACVGESVAGRSMVMLKTRRSRRCTVVEMTNAAHLTGDWSGAIAEALPAGWLR